MIKCKVPLSQKILPKGAINSSLFFLLFFSLFNFTCRKADRDSDTTTQMVSENGIIFFCQNDIFKQLHQVALSDSALNTLGSFLINDTLCIDTITKTNFSGFPDTVILDFGFSNGAACADGNLRRGKLNIIFSGRYGATSKTFTILPENYYLNDYKIEGKMSVTSRGRNASNNLSFYVQYNDGVISNDSLRFEFYAPASSQYNFFQREWQSGESTTALNDDIFLLTGSYGGKGFKVAGYKSEISTALKFQPDCKWNTSGKEKILPDNLSPREVDYGTGCDNKATVNINGKETEVALMP